jgi:hypothetical protein
MDVDLTIRYSDDRLCEVALAAHMWGLGHADPEQISSQVDFPGMGLMRRSPSSAAYWI